MNLFIAAWLSEFYSSFYTALGLRPQTPEKRRLKAVDQWGMCHPDCECYMKATVHKVWSAEPYHTGGYTQ